MLFEQDVIIPNMELHNFMKQFKGQDAERIRKITDYVDCFVNEYEFLSAVEGRKLDDTNGAIQIVKVTPYEEFVEYFEIRFSLSGLPFFIISKNIYYAVEEFGASAENVVVHAVDDLGTYMVKFDLDKLKKSACE